MPKVLILESTIADGGKSFSKGDIATLSDDDTSILIHLGRATADEKRVAVAERARDLAVAARAAAKQASA